MPNTLFTAPSVFLLSMRYCVDPLNRPSKRAESVLCAGHLGASVSCVAERAQKKWYVQVAARILEVEDHRDLRVERTQAGSLEIRLRRELQLVLPAFELVLGELTHAAVRVGHRFAYGFPVAVRLAAWQLAVPIRSLRASHRVEDAWRR